MNHDLIGIPGLIAKQKEQIEKIKYLTRVDNEKYLRKHPEIEFILDSFIIKLLEDRPGNTLQYAGEYFNKTDFKEKYEEFIEKKN